MSQYIPVYDSFAPQNSERYVPTTRMNVLSSVYLPGSDVDLQTGRIKPDKQRRCRTQGKRLEMNWLDQEERRLAESLRRENSKGGVRISIRSGVLIVAMALFLCGICILIQLGAISDGQRRLNAQERDISQRMSENAELETRIAEASDSAKICYAAANDLNMILAKSVEAIHLVAVDTRPMKTHEQGSGQNKNGVASQPTPAESTRTPAIASSGG